MRCFTLCVATGLSLMAGSSYAQDSLFDIPQSEADSYIDVGAAILSRPAYLGSNTQETDILPYIAGEYKGRLFLDPARGAGVHAINDGKLQLSVFANVASGRDANETGAFNDLVSISAFTTDAERNAAEDALEIKTSVVASASARYLFKYALADISVSVPVTGDVDGMRTELSLATKLPFEPVGLRVFPGVRATYTSKSWNETYYGINAAQSAATGLQTFDTDGDISVLGSYILATWDGLGDDIQLIGLLNYNWLQGDLQDSVLTPDDHGLSAVIGVARRF